MTELGLPTQTKASRTRHPALVLAAAALAVGLTAGLGVWQLDRAAQKIAMQAEIDERARLPELRAQEVATDAGIAAAQYGRLARLRGRWLADKTLYLDNRVMADRVGFFVVTPLMLEDGSAMLVQRGWVPRDAARRTHLPDFQTADATVEIVGRLARTFSQLYQLGEADTGLIRQNVDLRSYAGETGLALRPLVLVQLAGPEPDADGLMREWTLPVVDIHKNYGYAFQWFALSALFAGLYVWFQLIRPRRKHQLMESPGEQ